MRRSAIVVILAFLGLALSCNAAFNVGYAVLNAPAPTTIPPMNVGQPFSLQLTATGGNNTYTWSCCTAGTIPPGISISASGLVSGTPTTAGSYTPTFKVCDTESTPQCATEQIDPEVHPAKAKMEKTAFAVSGGIIINGYAGNPGNIVRQGCPMEIYGSGFDATDSILVEDANCSTCATSGPIGTPTISGTEIDFLFPYTTLYGGTLALDPQLEYDVVISNASGTSVAVVDPHVVMPVYTQNDGTLPYDSAGYLTKVCNAAGTACASIDPHVTEGTRIVNRVN